MLFSKGFVLLLTFGSLISAGGHAQESTPSPKEEKPLWQPYYISPRIGEHHVVLNGEWELGHRDTPVTSPADFSPEIKWIQVQVPNSVQWALYQAGELPHPYYHLNSRKYVWVPEKVWYYRRSFKMPVSASEQYVFLCFDGVGYYSRIWLNGVLLGRHEGMFAGPDIEVSRLLRSGSNELVVEVQAGSYGANKWDSLHTGRVILPWGLAGGHPSVTGPSGINPKEFLPLGIWQSVRLEAVPHVHLERPFLVTKYASVSAADLALSTEVFVNKNSFDFKLHPWHDDVPNQFRDALSSHAVGKTLELQVEFIEKGTGGLILRRRFPLHVYEGRNWVQEQIRLPHPKLWWPNGMGIPHMYKVNITLLEQGEAVDLIEFDYGIRTIETVPSAGPRTADHWANWQFVVNGRRLFIKGVNWSWPSDVLLHLPRERYAWQLKAARDAGVQMLRVWGGAYPETNEFYSLCNELGIMVWEDFPVANTVAPEWPQDVWEAQVLQTIFRLRNQTSLAVWCGGNEINPYATDNATQAGIVERSVADFDGTRFFVRSTPDPGDLHSYPDMDPTWFSQVYHLVPFVSEAGLMDLADAEALREVIAPEELNKPLRGIFTPAFNDSHPEFVHHFLQYDFSWVVKALWDRASQVDDMSAPTLDQLTESTHLAAAEFNAIACEQLEGNYPFTTGVMPWSYTIPWPIMFPAWMDHFGQATPMYYFSKRVYEPTHVMVKLPQLIWAAGEQVPITVGIVHAPANSRKGWKATAQILNDHFDTVWKQARTINFNAGPSVTNLRLGDYTIPPSLEDRFFFIVAELKDDDGKLISRSVYWPRCLKLAANQEFQKKYRASPQPSLELKYGPWLRPQVAAQPTTLALRILSLENYSANQSRLRVEIRNPGVKPAFFVHFDIQGTKRAFYGSDNFFWLAPGERRILNFEVLWRDPPTRDNAKFLARAWNAKDTIGGASLFHVPD